MCRAAASAWPSTDVDAQHEYTPGVRMQLEEEQ